MSGDSKALQFCDHRLPRALFFQVRDQVVPDQTSKRLLGRSDRHASSFVTCLLPLCTVARHAQVGQEGRGDTDQMQVDHGRPALLGQEGLDARLASSCQVVQPVVYLDELSMSPEMKRALLALIRQARAGRQPLRLYFHGPQGIGKRHSAEALAGELGTSLLAMDLLRIPGANDAGQDPSTGLIRGLCS